MKLARFVAAFVTLSLPVTALAQSQSAGGAIEGTVTDESGAALPGAVVTAKNPATGLVRETPTNAAGYFRAPLLPVGTQPASERP